MPEFIRFIMRIHNQCVFKVQIFTFEILWFQKFEKIRPRIVVIIFMRVSFVFVCLRFTLHICFFSFSQNIKFNLHRFNIILSMIITRKNLTMMTYMFFFYPTMILLIMIGIFGKTLIQKDIDPILKRLMIVNLIFFIQIMQKEDNHLV